MKALAPPLDSGNGEQIQFNNFESNYTLQVIMNSNWLDIYLIIAAIYISYQLSYLKLKFKQFKKRFTDVFSCDVLTR